MAPGELATKALHECRAANFFGRGGRLAGKRRLQKVLAEVAIAHAANNLQKCGSLRRSSCNHHRCNRFSRVPVAAIGHEQFFQFTEAQVIDRIGGIDDDYDRIAGGLYRMDRDRQP